jgi:signal transduction histidine kinase/ActR/RegA family two-component response regulator
MDNLEPQQHSLATILDLSRLVSSSLDLDVVLDRILGAARDLSGADIVTVMMPDDSGEQLRIVAAHGLTPELIAASRLRIGEGIGGWVALTGLPVHTTNLAEDARYTQLATPPDSCLFVLPLRVRDRTVGILNLSKLGQTELFSTETAQLLEIFASHAAIAIENAATATSLRYAATQERIASVVHREAGTSTKAAPMVRQILTDLAATLDDATCAVYLPDDSGAYSVLAAAPDGDLLPEWWQPLTPAAPLAEAAQEGAFELQVRMNLPDSRAGWLVARPAEERYWRRADRSLMVFAADQIALLIRNERLVSQEQRSRALSTTLSQLTAASNALVGQDSLLDFILEQLAQLLPYDSTGVFLFHDNEYARMVAGSGFRFRGTDVVLYMGPGSLTWDMLETRRAIYIPDVQRSPGWQPVPDADVIRSWIGAPLQVDGHIIGLLTIDKWTPNAFSPDDVQTAQLFADHVAVAINSQQTLRDAQLRATQLQVVHQASESLRAIRELQPLLDEVARLLHDSFGHYQVYICLVDGDELVITAGCGKVNGAADFLTLRRYSAEVGLTGWAVRHNRTLLVNNVEADQRFLPHPQTSETRAELVAPISHEGRVLGVIAIQSTKTGVFGQSDVYLTEAMASLTAMAMERIRRDEELRSVQEQLTRNERLRALGELASGVAHDFNNLLTSILGHTQLLLGDEPAPEIAEELRVIERAALDGAATVRRLQSFAQTSKALPMEPVWLSEVVTESLAITRPRWRDGPQSRGVQIKVVREGEALPPFAGDAPALRELVMNLVLNAVDAMPQGGTLHLATELLAAERSPLDEPTARLLVADTGIGMDDAVLQRIFEPFFTTKGAAGTGMGLAMAYGIVQRHQGTINVRSEPGHGTTFEIYLPARPVALEPQRYPSLSATPPPLRILVVDDDDGVRQVMARQIARMGYEVGEASSGESALQILATTQYDLICSDLGMPGMSGWELIELARKAFPGLATVLVTGWGDQIDAEEARGRGVDAVVAKPFDSVRLQQVIEEVHARTAGAVEVRLGHNKRPVV